MDSAKDANRTFGAEVVKRLEDSFGAVSDVKLLERRLDEIGEIDERLARISGDVEQAKQALPTFKSLADRNTLNWGIESQENLSAILKESRKRVAEEAIHLIGQIERRALSLARKKT